ncbi:MAG: hypothetical protein O2855_06200 [Planctomycetota bacterium]|nr:hypothetical protein [Planctomycetota bacterium]
MIRTLALTTSLAVSIFSAPALAQDVPPEVKSEFRQNIVRRDRMMRELYKLDEKAADAVADGQTPNATHSDQLQLQDEIDLLQLRLETMAVRWSLTIPEPPAKGVGPVDEAAATVERIEATFADGRGRTDRALNDRCLRMLASINYDAFLARN